MKPKPQAILCILTRILAKYGGKYASQTCAEITVADEGEFPFDEGESESSEAEEFPTEDGGEFPFDEDEGGCFSVEDDEIPSFCFGEDDQDDDESEDEDEDEDEDYEEYLGGMTF